MTLHERPMRETIAYLTDKLVKVTAERDELKARNAELVTERALIAAKVEKIWANVEKIQNNIIRRAEEREGRGVTSTTETPADPPYSA